MSSDMSDERREVARRLLEFRRYAREYDDREADVALAPRLVMKNGNSMYRNIAGSLEECGNFNLGYEQVIDRLADLIDPTCENKAIAINRRTPPEFRTDNLICSCCGTTFFADSEGINFPIDWAFCPECGARVISDDE